MRRAGPPVANFLFMKIVRIIARLNVGGPARHVVWLTDRLHSKGFDTTLIAGRVPGGEEDMGYFAAEHGVSPLYIDELSRELSPKDAISLLKIFRELRREKPDILHTHTAKAGTLGRAAAFLYRWATPAALIGKPRRLRVVHTFHGHVFHSYYGKTKTIFFKGIEKVLASLATDVIVVISDQQLREISGSHRVGRADQFRVIPLGLDLSPFQDKESNTLRGLTGASTDEMLVAFAGRLTEIKDVPLLLSAFAEAQAQVRMRLAVIGDGSLRGELEVLSHSLDTSERVHFLGNRSEIADLISGSDVVAISSLNEGTPLSLIEAMAAGKAVISTMVGGVVDLLGAKREEKDGFDIYERGVGVRGRDPARFAKGLIYLAKNEKLRKSLGSAGRSFVLENYSIDRLERDISSLYHELMSTDR